MKDWKIAFSRVTGRGHLQKKIPCQDYVAKLVKQHSSGVFYGLALADGAGSCKHSKRGAKFITKKTLKFLKSNFAKILKKKEPSQWILERMTRKLEDYAESKQIAFKELSSTLLFVVIKNNRYILGHIGDGVIGALDKEGLKTASQPENGEYANTTFFTTSVQHKNRLRISTGETQDLLGFILMSDGSGESLYDKRNKTLSRVNEDIINWLKDFSEEEVEKGLYNNLKETIAKRTFDDCSIGIIRAS